METTTSPLSIIIVLIFGACASPLPISKLEPVSNTESYWLNGMEVVTYSHDSLSVELGFVRTENEYFIFDVMITNHRSSLVLIDPSQLLYIPISIDKDTLNYVYAENPETRIINEEMRLAQLDADAKNNVTSSLISSTLELATAIAINSEETEENEYENNYLNEAYRIDYESNVAIDQLSYWETQSLRKTTLFPNHFVQGHVMMKWTRKADEVIVLVPVAGHEFEFVFNQRLYRLY